MLNVFLYLNKEEKWKQTTGQDEDENMKIIETYGNYIEKWSNENPGRARWLLKTGWKAQNLKFRFAPDKRLMPAEQYLARLMMDTMIRPLERPEESAIVSIFTPCEILQEAGLHPYNVEGFSCYLSASKAERAFLQQAENTGISETLCSYHKTFIGAAQKKVLPKPKCIVYTNLTCDANLLTFKKLAKMYDVPIFAIDVPMQQNEDNVQYVADQLRKLKDFIEECTGKKITDETLTERLRRSKRTLEKFAQYEKESADRYIPADLVTPLYAGMTNNLLLGTEEEETYVDRLLNDVKKAPAKKGKKIYWMHTIPFWSDAVKNELCFQEKAQIVGCELSRVCEPDFDPEKPYEAMARRMVYHALMEVRSEESKQESVMQRRQEQTVLFGSDTGDVSIPLEQHSLPSVNSKNRESRF